MTEPVLSARDRELWDVWHRTALAHATLVRHRRKVEQAKRAIGRALTEAPRLAVMWSGGKDSTAMVHLACVEMGLALKVFSEKDDLDYPGEEAYVTELARRWSLDLEVLRPPVSPAAWIAEHGHELRLAEDIHSRAAALSKECFYRVVEEAARPYDGIMLGLRAAESHGRKMNRIRRGTVYRKASGQWVCAPLSDWSGLDVMAYLAARGIEPLPVYRCIGFDPEHAAEPWQVRKSWWLPGASAAMGQTAWLRHYWPSLFGRLCDWMPHARVLT